jgi:hypothetical protein
MVRRVDSSPRAGIQLARKKFKEVRMKFLILISCIIALIFTVGCPTENQVATPITSAYRMAAEWEPVIGTIIAWPLIIPESLVIELAKRKMLLYVMVSDEINRYEAENTFKEWGMNMGNIMSLHGWVLPGAGRVTGVHLRYIPTAEPTALPIPSLSHIP